MAASKKGKVAGQKAANPNDKYPGALDPPPSYRLKLIATNTCLLDLRLIPDDIQTVRVIHTHVYMKQNESIYIYTYIYIYMYMYMYIHMYI